MKEYGEVSINGSVPKWMKLVMVFIDRVGFPAMAFILMFYLSFSSLEKVTQSISENTKVLIKISTSSDDFQKVVMEEHKCFRESQTKLFEKITMVK